MIDKAVAEVEFEAADFDFEDIDEELRVDNNCRALLNRFYMDLLSRGVSDQDASEATFCADYYLRDYLLDHLRQNIVRPRAGIVRFFAGNWFIVKTLDPEIAVLEKYLKAIAELYQFLHRQHYISKDELEYLLCETEQTEFYKKRIDSFLAICGEGYISWGEECQLEV
jgi:hypothetical protein